LRRLLKLRGIVTTHPVYNLMSEKWGKFVKAEELLAKIVIPCSQTLTA